MGIREQKYTRLSIRKRKGGNEKTLERKKGRKDERKKGRKEERKKGRKRGRNKKEESREKK